MVSVHESALALISDRLPSGWSIKHRQIDGPRGRVYVAGHDPVEGQVDTVINYRLPCEPMELRRRCAISLERYQPPELRTIRSGA